MTTAVSRRLNILCKIIKITALFIITRPVICERWHWKHLHDCTISLRGDIWVHTTSLILPLYWRTCIKTGKWAVMYFCAKGIDFASFYDFDIWFWNCSDSAVFFVFHFIRLLHTSLHRKTSTTWLCYMIAWLL